MGFARDLADRVKLDLATRIAKAEARYIQADAAATNQRFRDQGFIAGLREAHHAVTSHLAALERGDVDPDDDKEEAA